MNVLSDVRPNLGGGGTVYPPGSCHGGPALVIAGGLPTIYRQNYFNGIANCGQSAQQGKIATPDDPDILKSFRAYVNYGGTEYLVESKDIACVNGTPVFRTTPGFTSSFSGSVPILDAEHPVTIRWVLELIDGKKVFADTINWFGPDGKSVENAYLGGTSKVFADKPLAGSKTFEYGSVTMQGCGVSAGMSDAGPIWLSWENGDSQNTGGDIKRTFRITLVDFSVGTIAGGGGGPDTNEAAIHYTNLLNIIKGTSRTIGTDGDICQKSATSDKDIPRVKISYANREFELGGGFAVGGFVTGRWVKGTGKVKWSSCDSSATIYDSLPQTLAIGVEADPDTGLPKLPTTTGISISQGMWIDQSQRVVDMASGTGTPPHTLNIPIGPLESMHTEEWWDPAITVPFRWFYPVTGGGAYSYCTVALKYKFEGPL